MKIHCRTNLDLHSEEWPTELPECPSVGDLIQSRVKWGQFQLRLKVVSVTWKYTTKYHIHAVGEQGMWVPTVELHIYDGKSIAEFQAWYDNARGPVV